MPTHTTQGECHILIAARELFARLGYDAVSMSRIASEAGVSKANLYHHYGSKEDLYFSVLCSLDDKRFALWDDLIDSSQSVIERLRHFAQGHLEHICAQPEQVRLVMREVAEHSEHRGKQLAQGIFGSGIDELVTLVNEGRDNGELRADIDAIHVVNLIMAANVAFFQWRDVMRHLPDAAALAEDPKMYAQRVMEIILDGARAPRALNDGSTHAVHGRATKVNCVND